MGVDMVELDVRPPRDGVLVLMHDDTIDRTTNGAGRLSDFTYEELQQFHLQEGKGGKDAALTQEQIPTFREAMGSARVKRTRIVDALHSRKTGVREHCQANANHSPRR